MREWIIACARYFLSDWRSLLIGGVVVVGVVIFLMGVLKKTFINKVKNTIARKVILSWASVVMTLPATAVSIFCNGYDFQYFWGIFAVNAVSTILIYWFYENTALRDALALLGKKTIGMIVAVYTKEDAKTVVKDINQEAENLLKSSLKSTSKYKDDDLKF